MTTDLTTLTSIDKALSALTDPQSSIEDRAAVYAYIHQVQLRLNRALRKVKDELIYHMEQEGSLGPLSVKATAAEVQYPVNDEGNWSDDLTQSFLRNVVLPVTPEYVRIIPEHLEIDTKALGEAVHLGDPAARQLWDELNRRRWRTEGYRRLSIAVAEAKPPRKEAA